MGEAATYQYASMVAKHHEVLVLAPRHPKATEKIVFSDPEVDVINIFSPVATEQVNNAFRHINHFRPDIIHMIQSPLCFYYPYYLRHLTPSSKWLIDFRSPHIGEKDDPALRRYFYMQFYVDGILTHFMPGLKTNIRPRFRRAYEIPPGVDLSLFEKNIKNPANQIPRNFVFIGSITERRNLQFLVTSFGEFSKKNNIPVTLDIFGAGNAAGKLSSYIANNSLQHCVVLRGVLPQKELLKKLKTYDAGIAYVPYKYFSLAPSLKSLEYAAAGIPVLASNTEGHRAYNLKYGFKFKLFQNTREDFHSTMSDILQQGFSREDIAVNTNAVGKFDWKYIIEKRLLPLYTKFVS